jgi:hypothetical protein
MYFESLFIFLRRANHNCTRAYCLVDGHLFFRCVYVLKFCYECVDNWPNSEKWVIGWLSPSCLCIVVICYVHTRALLLAFSALECRMRLITVMHAIAYALNMLNGVENSHAVVHVILSPSGFSCNTACSICLLVYE